MKLIKKLTALTGSLTFLSLTSPVFAQGGSIDIVVPTPEILKITDLGKFISAILAAILVIAALAAFVFLLLGGLSWITSGGDKAAVEGAQKRIQAAIIGLFVVFAAWAVMLVVGRFLGIENIFSLQFPTGV